LEFSDRGGMSRDQYLDHDLGSGRTRPRQEDDARRTRPEESLRRITFPDTDRNPLAPIQPGAWAHPRGSGGLPRSCLIFRRKVLTSIPRALAAWVLLPP